MSDQRNLALVAPIGTPAVTPVHALSPGAQPLPSLMIQPPARDSLLPATDTGIQYLSQGPTGPIPISQSIDPNLVGMPGTGAHAAYQANLERAADVALSFGPGVIGGQKALTAPISSYTAYGKAGTATLDTALAAEQGVHASIPSDRDAIFYGTGWFRGADDKWRFIIPDEDARLRTENLRSQDVTNTYKGETYPLYGIPFSFDKQLKLGDVLDHPDLYNAYPWAKDIEVRATPLANSWDLRGAYDRDANRIYLSGARGDSMLSTLLHETQHAIQGHEGFARGGNTAEFLPSTYNAENKAVQLEKEELEKQISNMSVEPRTVAGVHGFYPYERSVAGIYPDNIKEAVASLPQDIVDRYRDVQTRYKSLMDQHSAAVQNYLNLGGEIEARSVQAMLHEHQWSRPPWEVPMGTDFMGRPIPYPEQTEHIIRFDRPSPGGSTGVVLTPVDHDPFAIPPSSRGP